MIADLLKVNADQEKQVDALISKMSTLTMSLAPSPPLVTGPKAPVSAGLTTSVTTSVTVSHVTSLSTPPLAVFGGQPGVTSGSAGPTMSPSQTTRPHTSTSYSQGLATSSGYATGLGYPPAQASPYQQQFSVGTAGLGQSFPVSTVAPADVMSAPLTSALDRLSLAIDPAMGIKSQGSALRPEFYVQHLDQKIPLKSLDHNKLSYASLSYGMCRVAKYLYQSGGDFQTYLDHMLYVTRLASLGEYVDCTFAHYDRSVVDAVLSKEIPTFVPGYPLATSLHFHAANMITNQNWERFSSGSRGRGRGRGRGGKNDRKGPVVPEGFPDSICYFHNYANCDGCSKNHVCRICNGPHKAPGCNKRKENRENQ